MNFQKIALRKLLYDKDMYLMNHLSKDMFTKQYKRIFVVISSYYDKTSKIINKDYLKAVITNNFSDEIAKILHAIVDSLEKVSSDIEDDELLAELRKEQVLHQIDSVLPDLVEAAKNKKVDEVKSLLSKMESSLVYVDDTKTKDITEIEYNVNSMSTIDIFLPSMANAGLQLAGLSIVGGTSGGGKSIFALNQALYSYKQGHKVSILSLELPIGQVLSRLYAMENKISYKELVSLPKDEWKRTIDEWRNSFFEKDRFYINYFRYNVDKIKETILFDIRRGVKVFVIDYLNLVKQDYSKEEWKSLSDLVKELHDIAITYGVVIISPTQVNLSENKNKKIEVTTRGSKELEYSASVLLFIYQNSEEFKENVARIIVKKSRNSRKFTAIVKTDFEHMKFEDSGIILDEV